MIGSTMKPKSNTLYLAPYDLSHCPGEDVLTKMIQSHYLAEPSSESIKLFVPPSYRRPDRNRKKGGMPLTFI
jgi:hypothetical protein